MNNFNLMILAAGYGKRMKNLTHSNPKPLLKINNKDTWDKILEDGGSVQGIKELDKWCYFCLLYTSPSPRD